MLSPQITEFSLEFDKYAVEAVIPNPNELPSLLKNEPVSFFVLMRPSFKGSTKFTLTYRNSATKTVHRSDLSLYEQFTAVYPFLEKMAQHRMVSLLCESINNKERLNDAFISKIRDIRTEAISRSVRHQVLCELTAFICIAKNGEL